MSVDLGKAVWIPGWMGIPELSYLAGEAKRHKRIVEIGSYQGLSTRAMADNTEGFVLAIDDWYGPRTVYIAPGYRAMLFDMFYDNCEDLILKGKVWWLKADHKTDIKIDFEPDMVFIDGDHEYEAFRHDFHLWLPRLAKGGLLCGHDAEYPGVKQVLQESGLEYEVVNESPFIWRLV
jgi:hypothetical protein